MFSRKFPKLSIYVQEMLNEVGTISLIRYDVTVGLYFCSDNEKTENPFIGDSNFLHPLRSPYVFKGGHHIFDLNYFSEVTVIDSPTRICFHDPAQDPGLSINFEDKETYRQFFDYLSTALTIIAPGLPGFYSIIRCVPPLSNNPKFATQVASFRRHFSIEKELIDICEIQNVVIPMITQFQKPSNMTPDEIKSWSSDKSKLIELLHTKFLPKDAKVDAWCLLTGIGKVETPNSDVITLYKNFKNQWFTLTDSQFRRSSKRYSDIAKITAAIENDKKRLLTVVADESILQISFNIIMSLVVLYDFLGNHIDEVITLLGIVYYIFIKSVNNGKLYQVKDDVEYDQETIEAVAFWSMIYLLEACEVKNWIFDIDNKKTKNNDYTGDLCFLVHPHLSKILESKGITSFVSLKSVMCLFYSNLLGLNHVTDCIFQAIASGNVFSYVQSVILAGIFLNFPNIDSSDTNIDDILSQLFQVLTPQYLMCSGLVLMQNITNLIDKYFPQLGFEVTCKKDL